MAMASAALRNSQVRISSPSDQLFEYFVNTALMPDGCIALWFIRESTGRRVAAEIAQAIWDQSVSRIKKNTKPILRVQGSLDYLGGPERIHFKPTARAPVELRIEAQRLFPTNVYGKRSVLRIPLDLRLVTLWNLGTNAELDEERKRPAGLTSPLNCSSVPIPGQLAYLLCGRPETLTPALLLRFIVSTRVHVTDEQTEAQLIIAADTREKHLCQINIVKEARHGLYTIHIYCEKAAFRQRLLTDLQALILVTAFGFTHGPSAALRAAPEADVLTERFDYLIQEFST
ncbi:unnamed protein product, partial [Mesorhabditis spiculigera]